MIMTDIHKMVIVIYLLGISLIIAGMELVSRGVDSFQAGMILLPLFGVATGFSSLICDSVKSKKRIVWMLFSSFLVVGFVLLLFMMDALNLPLHWTGIPALVACLLILFFVSKKKA